MRPRIIGIAGHARSGKSTAAAYLRVTFGATVCTNSEPLGNIISKIGWSHDRRSYAGLSTALFDVFGRDILAHHWIRVIKQDSKGDLYVVDGIRYLEELKVYREMSDFHLLGIICSDKMRYQRTKTAKDREKDRDISYKMFLKSKESITESCVDDIVLFSNETIQNNGSKNDFFVDISSAFNKFLW